MTQPTTKTCPRCKGAGFVGASAGRSDGNCLSCGGKCVVLLPFARRDLAIRLGEKHLGEIAARGAAEATRKAAGGWEWTDADDRALTAARDEYRKVRASLAALRALSDNCTYAQVEAAQ